jgi:hypothetical protein
VAAADLHARPVGRDASQLTGRWALVLVGVSVALTATTAALGPSVAESPLGHHGGLPLHLSVRPGPWWVVALLAAACVSGAGGVLLALRALRRGWRPRPRRLLALAAAAVALLVLLPPIGSADPLSYAAYGRIAAAGDDPYLVAPDAWRGGHDPVASAVERPWRSTRSIYGPVATGEQALAATLGGDSVASTVAWLSVVNGLAFWLAGWLLLLMSGPDPARRARAVLLWTLNPLLLALLVAGGHVDAFALVWAVAGLAVLPRTAVGAGALLGAAVATKLSLGLFVLAAAWPLRRSPPALARLVLATVAVVVGTYLPWGASALGQVRQASRFVSLATPWRLVVGPIDAALGIDAGRRAVGLLAVAAAVLAALALVAALRPPRGDPGDPDPRATDPRSTDPRGTDPRGTDPRGTDTGAPDPRPAAVWAAVVVVAAWLLTAPYVLPWYDAALWAPLSLLAASPLDGLAVARTLSLALAYIPGRVEIPASVAAPTLWWRTQVTPWIGLLLLLAVLGWGARRAVAALRPRPAPTR